MGDVKRTKRRDRRKKQSPRGGNAEGGRFASRAADFSLGERAQELQLPAMGRRHPSLYYIFFSSPPVLHSRRVKRAIILVNSEQLAVIKHRKPSQLGTQLFLNKIPPDCFVGLGTTVIINPGERSLGRLHTGRGCARLVASSTRFVPAGPPHPSHLRRKLNGLILANRRAKFLSSIIIVVGVGSTKRTRLG